MSDSPESHTAHRARTVVAYADTNLFVALFATDDHPSHAAAVQLFQRVAEGVVRLIVTALIVAELAYVTRSVLKWNRATVSERLAAILETDGLIVVDSAVLLRTLALYQQNPRLDFADAYLAACALELGPPVVASFDADFDRLTDLTRIRQ